MAWTAPRTWVTGELVTAALLNTHLRDNLLATGVAQVTTAGDIVYATGANALSRLAVGTANQVLAVNSGATAVEWQPAGGGLEGGSYWGENLIRWTPDAVDGVQPENWDEATANVTLTEEDATGAGIPQKHERVFKAVWSGGAGQANYVGQTLTHSAQDLLDESVSIVSGGCWVYTATAGTTTLELYDVGGAASLGTATTTATSTWTWLEVKNKTIGTTSTRFQVYHSADPATLYFTTPMLNIGAVVRPWDISRKHSPRVAKAWVQFNGSGTVAINDSFNVSSVTDNGTGDYTINYRTAFASNDYAVAIQGVIANSAYQGNFVKAFSAGSTQIYMFRNEAGSMVDVGDACLVAFGDQ